MSRDALRGSRGPTSTVRPSLIVIHKPSGPRRTLTTGLQPPSWQHSWGYHDTVVQSASWCVWPSTDLESTAGRPITMAMTMPALRTLEYGVLEIAESKTSKATRMTLLPAKQLNFPTRDR
jgi:hypothetical protein